MTLSTGLFVLLLIAASAFFSISEISLAAARRFRLQRMAEEGNADAARVIALQSRPGDFFTVVQIGVNAVSILGGLVGEATFSARASAWLSAHFPEGNAADNLGFLLTFLLTTALFIQFADLIPKRLAMLAPERCAVTVVRPMLGCAWVLRPLVLLFDGVANAILRLFKLPARRDESMTADEIVAVIDAGAAAGTVARTEHHVIENVFELGERYVTSAMTPREQVTYFLVDDDEAMLRAKIAGAPHSKYPLCRDGIDNAYAYVATKLLLAHSLAGERGGNLLASLKHATSERLLAVPDTLSLAEMLDRFREAREDFAVVVNEYALVVGVISLADVTGHLIGAGALPGDELIVQRDANSWLVDGSTPVDDLRKVLGLDELPHEESYETVAGLMMWVLKKLPRKAESVNLSGYRFEVVDVDHLRVDQVMVTREMTPPAPDSASEG
ncbi:hemolysin family protein [Chitiniphilus eburneus]|uniref:Polyamine export protein n=1 Tax=Chitiniphilus eburneus TaxID=2571148 RepID=A0A4U0PPQ8_9NEIS|nr:hemolysin family protein [Chitiniphilus eburneus]TJZ69372.1 HlyC/CorC family transporter [Chitiniphilus eburneus]